MVHSVAMPAERDFEHPTEDAYRLLVDQQVAMDFEGDRMGGLQGWLARNFNEAGRVPDLRSQGYALQGARMMSTPEGAAAMLLADDTILTGTSPEAINPSVEVCHELEPYCGAHRLGQSVVASVCLHRKPGGQVVVLSPCGVCRERLAVHGPDVLVAVAAPLDPTVIVWKPLKDVLPDYWMTAFPDEIDSAWRS